MMARLAAVKNQVLAEITTGTQSHARFSDGYPRSTGSNAPTMAPVKTALSDFAFISLAKPRLTA